MLASRHFNGPICWNSMFLANVDCQRGSTNQSDFDIFDQNRLTFI